MQTKTSYGGHLTNGNQNNPKHMYLFEQFNDSLRGNLCLRLQNLNSVVTLTPNNVTLMYFCHIMDDMSIALVSTFAS